MSEPGPPAPPVPPGASPGASTARTGEPPGSAAARPGGRRRGGTAGDMVRSMLVIIALVAVVYVAVPRPHGRIQQPVDVGAAVAQASDAGVALDAPRVPQAWKPNAASFEPDPVEGLPTLTLGWVLPDGTFAGVRATRGATPTWIGTATGGGRPAGGGDAGVTLDGRDWQVLESPAGDARQRSLVLAPDGSGAGVTYVVTGTAPGADLRRVAAEVVPG